MKYFDMEGSVCSKENLLNIAKTYNLKIREDIEYFTVKLDGIITECVNTYKPFEVGEVGVKSVSLNNHYTGPYIHVDTLSNHGLDFSNGKFVTQFKLSECLDDDFSIHLSSIKEKLSKIFIF
jgi:hypothetical protein